ncbi:MAG: arsenate reductase ArsC [Flavobacteriales bacterium]|nr:arsenate reductase ArsC [Flavobacteriales bacterium]
MKKSILVLCTGNSCRSQMAEGFLKFYGNESLEVHSAGLEAHGLNQRAVLVMNELGIDISNQKSEILDKYLNHSIDILFTVCNHAEESCPVFPGAKEKVHHSFLDPAQAAGTEEEILDAFRSTRDAIDTYCKDLVSRLLAESVS